MADSGNIEISSEVESNSKGKEMEHLELLPDETFDLKLAALQSAVAEFPRNPTASEIYHLYSCADRAWHGFAAFVCVGISCFSSDPEGFPNLKKSFRVVSEILAGIEKTATNSAVLEIVLPRLSKIGVNMLKYESYPS